SRGPAARGLVLPFHGIRGPRDGAGLGGVSVCPVLPQSIGPRSARRRPRLAVAKEAARRFACFALDLRALRALERLFAKLCRHQLLNLELLLGGERQQLVRGLRGLQPAFGALASLDECPQRRGVAATILHDAPT